jgi:hypothetical protein
MLLSWQVEGPILAGLVVKFRPSAYTEFAYKNKTSASAKQKLLWAQCVCLKAGVEFSSNKNPLTVGKAKPLIG